MRVAHLSTWDVRGGAARAAYRLHRSLRDAGVASQMVCRWKSSEDPDVVACGPTGYLALKWLRLRRLQTSLEQQWLSRSIRPGEFLVSLDRTELGGRVLRHLRSADVVHFHWINLLVDVPSALPALACGTPLVWTLHDMNPFTGGCHYAGRCTRYRESCGNCPQLPGTRAKDLTARIWSRKRRALAAVPAAQLRIVAPSQWLARCAAQSSLLGDRPIQVIPYGIDTAAFCPIPRAEARRILGVPPELPAVAVVADSLKLRGKGFHLLAAAAAMLARRTKLLVLSVGANCPDLPPELNHHHLGHLADEQQLAAAYSSADVFVCPSLEDNLPNTVLEAMACGVPVVGFDVGGIPDMVRPGVTGILAPEGDVPGLAAALETLLADCALRAKLGANARRVVEEEYSLQQQCRSYMELYRSLLEERSAPCGRVRPVSSGRGSSQDE